VNPKQQQQHFRDGGNKQKKVNGKKKTDKHT
jgi:hypothetical protein